MIHFNIHLSCLIFQKDNTNEMKIINETFNEAQS